MTTLTRHLTSSLKMLDVMLPYMLLAPLWGASHFLRFVSGLFQACYPFYLINLKRPPKFWAELDLNQRRN